MIRSEQEQSELSQVLVALKQGRVIAYPTEAVYGLGCDPSQSEAILSLRALKQRLPEKGLILISDQWGTLLPYLDLRGVPEANLKIIQASWPGPYTWVFPTHPEVSSLLTGVGTSSLAVRVTAHPIARVLCSAFGAPIVSTSANPAGERPAKTADEVLTYFSTQEIMVLPGELGGLKQPTVIRDALSLAILRDGN